MEITGYDYVLYSQISFFEIIEALKKDICKIWHDATIEDIEFIYGEKLWIFCAKDRKMYDDLNSGYEINEDGEGCFSIIGERIKFEDSILINKEGDTISHEIRILFKDFWCYTIILPDLVENNTFVEQVYNVLINHLGGKLVTTSNSKKHKPVQFFL